jgi:hypothetical protein
MKLYKNDLNDSIRGGGHCRSWKKTEVELNKCDLLCANCHAETREMGSSVVEQSPL